MECDSASPSVRAFNKTIIGKKDKLYDCGRQLYEELNSQGLIERLGQVPQLGLIKVAAKLKKTRLDYIGLQLDLHNLIRKSAKLPDQRMRIGYNTTIPVEEFCGHLDSLSSQLKITTADCLQILSIVYSLGHFYPTFTSSRAVIMQAGINPEFREWVLASCRDPKLKSFTLKVLEEENYHQLHLINSLLTLEGCDQTKISVKIAQALLYAYLMQEEIPKDNKLKGVFTIFRAVRSVSYLAYDLPIAPVPFMIDLADEDGLLFLFSELLASYRDNTQAKDLILAINKLLSDTVYNEESNCICHYGIARKLSGKLADLPRLPSCDYYQDLWLDPTSYLNQAPVRRKDFNEDYILKLTFRGDEKTEALTLLALMEKMNDVRVGYYDRHPQGHTILISLRKKAKNKVNTALLILRRVVRSLKKMKLDPADDRYLLVTKFFLYYLFGQRKLEILPTIHESSCVICTFGSKNRLNAIQGLLDDSKAAPNILHEGEFLRSRLLNDKRKDTSLTLPCSIVLYGEDGKTDFEFDGLIIHPNRVAEQVVFLEAKLMKSKSIKARTELHAKLKDLGFDIPLDDLTLVGNDCYYPMTIR